MTETALLQFAGRLHPLLLHLPIGLWLGIAALEFGGLVIRRRAPRATIASLAWFAAIAGCLAATAGWLLSLEPGYGGRTLELHRWLGVGAGILGVCAATVAALQARRPFQVLLLAEVLVLMAGGHLGSELTHGEDWLTSPFAEPAAPKATPTSPTGAAPAAVAPVPASTPGGTPPPEHTDPARAAAPTHGNTAGDPAGDPAGAPAVPPAVHPAAAVGPTYASAIAPLLESRCGACHSDKKKKGKLALHTRAAIEKGGKSGPVLVAGHPDDSELLKRLRLPEDDEDHMPPADEEQPTAAEIALLQAWIAAGAPFEGSFVAAAGAAPSSPPQDRPASPPAPPPADPPPNADAQPAPKDGALAPAPTPTPAPAKDGDGAPAATATATASRAAADPALAAGIAALRTRLAHVQPIAHGTAGLWVDFAAIAPSLTEAEARTLLAPVAAQIVDLGLARVPVGDDLLAQCARMPQLRRLDLRRTRVTTRGLAALRGHEHLEHIVLAETRLDDDAVPALLAMPCLQRVQVWNSGLSAAAVARLRARPGLTVDDGERTADAALETEPAPYADEAADHKGVATAAGGAATASQPTASQPNAAPPTAAPDDTAQAALAPINAVCPVSGKPIDARFVILHDRRAIGFCCPNCPKQFWAEPARFPVTER